MRLTLLLALLLSAFSLPTAAQTKHPRRVQQPQAPAVKLYQEVETTYDKFENRTSVSVGPMPLKSNPSVKFSLVVMFDYPGNVPPADVDEGEASGWVYLVLQSDTQDIVLSEHDRMVIIADGERLVFPKMHYNSDSRGRKITERRGVFTSRRAISQMANAGQVEGRMGVYDFTLTPGQTKALRDFLAAIPPARK